MRRSMHYLTAHPRSLITIAVGLAVMLGAGVAVLYIGAGRLAPIAATGATPTPTIRFSATATPQLSTATATPSPTAIPSDTPSATASPSIAPTAGATPANCVDVAAMPSSQRLNQLIMVSGDFSNLGASAPYARAGVGAFVFFGQPPAGSGPAITSSMAA